MTRDDEIRLETAILSGHQMYVSQDIFDALRKRGDAIEHEAGELRVYGTPIWLNKYLPSCTIATMPKADPISLSDFWMPNKPMVGELEMVPPPPGIFIRPCMFDEEPQPKTKEPDNAEVRDAADNCGSPPIPGNE